MDPGYQKQESGLTDGDLDWLELSAVWGWRADGDRTEQRMAD